MGTNTDTWNGKDNTKNIVPDGAYTFTIQATNATTLGEYTPEYIPGAVGITDFAIKKIFDPHSNEPCQINYRLADYAEVLIKAGGSARRDPNWAILNWKPRPPGFNTDSWDGRDANGNLVNLDTATIAIWARALPDEPMIVVSELKLSVSTDPYSIIPAYREFTTITYTLSEPAQVSVSVYKPDGILAKTLEQNVAKQAGTYELIWDGTDSSNKIVSKEGDCTVRIEATDAGGKTTTTLGNINEY
jgi:flagellar hook assembly protein FlgD